MKIHFNGETAALKQGIEIVSKVLGFETAEGMEVDVENVSGSPVVVSMRSGRGLIRYGEKSHFFRALGLLIEHMRYEDEFELAETPQFTTIGAMADVSQCNAVLKVETIKRLLTRMALMGMNLLMLYTEDNYYVEGEPYFGYMRGRYTKDDMKACDDFADALGIEMIPCIQTLAHLKNVLQWRRFLQIKDDDDILLAGDEEVYELIDKMVSSVAGAYRSGRIHIGMDEATKLGQGNYLRKNGYRGKFDIMTEHLGRVLEITKKHGLEPMIWSDMYFRESSKTFEYYDLESSIPESVRQALPKDVRFVYWDYYHLEESFYAEWIRRHREFGAEPLFAGGIWGWNGYGVNYEKTFAAANAALRVCKREGIKEVFATIWGDVGAERNVFAHLLGLQLFAEHAFEAEPDEEKIRRRFLTCTGCQYDDFRSMSALDLHPRGGTPPDDDSNPGKYLLWQDIMTGFFDCDVLGIALGGHYADLEKKMAEASSRNGEFGAVFSLLEKLCAVLSLKAELGNEVRLAYLAGDRQRLLRIAESVLPEISGRVEALRVFHRELWHRENLPFGWEVYDLRYGGLISRIDSAAERLTQYVHGSVDRLEELEEERLPYSWTQGLANCCGYPKIVSASKASYS